MGRWLEREWQRLGGGALILLPFSLVFMAVVALRRLAYRARLLPAWRAPVPVVVVGNVTAGGTGKTPLTLAVIEALARRGFTPGVVSRGYGRVPRGLNDPLGVVRVYPDVATPEHFGDEPVLIALRSRVPVYVSHDRPAAARALLQAHPEVDVLVSDDGLQHYALARDVEIAVVDGERRFGNGLMLPAGPLREPVSRLASVDAVVVNGGWSDSIPGSRQFAMTLGGERFVALAGGQQLAPHEFALAARGRNVAAVAGIGYPERFFDHLARLGVSAKPLAFPDHHPFQAKDLKIPGAEIVVMTEKDAVKCAAFADARMWFLRIDAILPPDFEEFLATRIAQRLRSADGSQAA
ncbi:MAG TPA: tetraacyldisaccharide 4'-kinase [Usitatibacter sp.]|nr:tetraacyldisaccharide 4'-kinase [Usitatibacter sp.]